MSPASPVEALRMADDAIARAGETPALLEARLQALCDLGRFETALELARRILELHPTHSVAAEYFRWLSENMAPPPLGTPSIDERSYATELPRSVLLRIQQAVHHYRYRGLQLVKNPLDLALYSLLFERVRPRTVIEIGSKAGGSAIWFADLLLRLGIDAHVHSFDVFPVTDVTHPTVTFHHGDGRRLHEAIDEVFVNGLARPLLVVEDADHAYETTIAVLRWCHLWLHQTEYVVIEDGNLSDLYPELYPGHTSGPHRAIREFLAEYAGEYEIDAGLCDFFGYNATTCSNGFLRRVSGNARSVCGVGMLRQRPWTETVVPDEVSWIPSMLSDRERGLLYWLARSYFSGLGRIIDAGCFLGGSTAALACGLRDRPGPPHDEKIVSYDLFRVEEYTLEDFGASLPSTVVGSSFRAAFDRNLAQFGDGEVREGDICAIGWSGESIEILFLDVVKTWEIQDVVLTQFFPCLIAGRSVILQQDYLWGSCPWIHMTMELIADYVEMLDWMPHGTVAYLLHTALPPEILQTRLRDLGPEQQLALMDSAAARWTGEPRGMVELARVMLIAELYGLERAADEFYSVRARYSESDWVQGCVRVLADMNGWW
jgi:cephalosporin hydroxylase